MSTPDDLGDLSMLELFRVEAENQTAALSSGLLELERAPAGPEQLESLMRAAHSLKGAARIVNLPVVVTIAHAMEDCFVAAQAGHLQLQRGHIDVLLRGVDLLANISKSVEPATEAAPAVPSPEVNDFLKALKAAITGTKSGETLPKISTDISALSAQPSSAPPALAPAAPTEVAVEQPKPESQDRVLRLTAENLNRLLGLAGESLVESRWLRPFSESLQRLKRMHSEMEQSLDGLRQVVEEENLSDRASQRVAELANRAAGAREYLNELLQEIDLFDRRSAHLSNRLYLEVLRARMRPFADGVRRFPRMVRDLAHAMGKQINFEIIGENTQVDRDILDRLEAPLAHLLRNAVDHGCEMPEERQRTGKPPEATIRLEARHSAGMLIVIVSDDGAGVDVERVRQSIVEKKLATPIIAEKLNESELLEFLFLPGFSMKDTVTEISGRGVGLDIVQNLARSVRGGVRISSQPGKGVRFQLQLPLTLSVLRTLLVEISGEPYAIPLSQIASTLKLPREKIETLEGRHHFNYRDQSIGLLTAHQVLECGEPKPPGNELPVVVLGERDTRYGLIVDRFLGERELVVQALDPRLGKVKDISAAALMEDGSPVLIVDVEDMVRSIEKLISGGVLDTMARPTLAASAAKRKRVLVVDDSLTVRELERKLLVSRGYHTDVAVDGMDGWNAIRTGDYDLVITDVDMPRMDGIELTRLIKKDPHFKSLPVMIVSYKDRDEDRLRGLNAGADYYLTKGSFHDETLINAVQDLVGEPES